MMVHKEENDMEQNLLSLCPFADSLFSDEIKEIALDVSEVYLDSMLDDFPILQSIPALKVFIGLGKTAKNIQAKAEWKNQLAFLCQFKSGNVDKNALNKRKAAYRNKEKWFLREVENLVVYMSKFTSITKAKLQAEIYMDYLNGIITWERYMESLDVLLHLFLCDIPHLIEIYRAEIDVGLTREDILTFRDKIKTEFKATECRRLMAIGLLHQLHPMSFAFSLDNYFILSDTGRYFCDVISRFKESTELST